MIPLDSLELLLTTMSFTVALFGAISVLGDGAQRSVGWGLALFLGIAAFDNLEGLVGLWGLYPQLSWICGLELVATCLYGPAIYLYVLTVTGRAPSLRQITLCLGLALTLALGLLALFLSLPHAVRIALLLGTPIADGDLAQRAWITAGTIRLVFLALISGFLLTSWRALDDNLTRLGGLFSSVEDRALTWLRGVMVMIMVGSGWVSLQGLLESMINTDGWLGAMDAAITLTWISLVAHFGIRQRPALQEADIQVLQTRENGATEKYARSALDSDRMQKLGDRMHSLMRSQALYRDPALSLRALAERVGASPNYISQTLNDHLGISFFDFVNRFRVDEAEALLRNTDRSVTDIALEVGFNSRSTFNAAIRKHRNTSPTELRRRSDPMPVRAVPPGPGPVRT